MNHSIEITKEAARRLIGNDETSWRNFETHETHEMTEYFAHGLRIQTIHNFVANVTQYFVQDINA